MNRTPAILLLAALFADQATAQRISGRVTDATGTPIPQARVMLRHVGDSSEASLRVAITDQQGMFRLNAGKRGLVEVSVLRIGFRPDSARRIDLTADDAEVSLAMSAVAFHLATVRVTPRPPQCVPLDGDQQSPDVRDLVKLAQEVLRARRFTERDYGVTVREVTQYTRVDQKRASERTYTLAAGDSSRAAYDERLAAGPIGRARSMQGGGFTSWIMPQEGLFLSPTFTKRLCFENSVFPAANNDVEIRFRQTDGTRDELTLAGSFIMSSEAMIREIRFRVLVQGRRIGEGTLTYANTDFDGASFPFIARHVQQTYVEVIPPGSRVRELQDGGRIEVGYTYSSFVRQRDPFGIADD